MDLFFNIAICAASLDFWTPDSKVHWADGPSCMPQMSHRACVRTGQQPSDVVKTFAVAMRRRRGRRFLHDAKGAADAIDLCVLHKMVGAWHHCASGRDSAASQHPDCICAQRISCLTCSRAFFPSCIQIAAPWMCSGRKNQTCFVMSPLSLAQQAKASEITTSGKPKPYNRRVCRAEADVGQATSLQRKRLLRSKDAYQMCFLAHGSDGQKMLHGLLLLFTKPLLPYLAGV